MSKCVCVCVCDWVCEWVCAGVREAHHIHVQDTGAVKFVDEVSGMCVCVIPQKKISPIPRHHGHLQIPG